MVHPILIVFSFGCGSDFDTHREPDQIVWADGEARLRVEKTIEESFPDSLVSYRVDLDHVGRPPIVVDARTVQLQHLSIAATRLPNAHVAWIINKELVCEELPGGVVACNDFTDLGCLVHPGDAVCCTTKRPGVQCTCGTGRADPAAVGSLIWAANDRDIDYRLRAGVALALARMGHASEVTNAIDEITDDEYSRIWLDAARIAASGDRPALDELRAMYRKTSYCNRETIFRACGRDCVTP